MRPRSMDPAGHARQILLNGGLLIQLQIPWPVRSAIIFADFDAAWVSVTPWEPDEWIAVTVHEDGETHWWIIWEAPAGEYSIAEVEHS
jgi:hypothetical protein